MLFYVWLAALGCHIQGRGIGVNGLGPTHCDSHSHQGTDKGSPQAGMLQLQI